MHKSLRSLTLSLINVGYAELDTSWDFENVVSPFNRLYYIKNGKAKVYHGGRVYELKPDHLYLIPSFAYGRYTCDHSMSQYYLSFYENMDKGLSIYHLRSFVYEVKANDQDLLNFERLLKINPGRDLINNDPKVYDNYHTLQSFEQLNEQMSSSQYLETQGILLTLFSRFITEGEAIVNNDSLTSQKVTETIHYVSEHLNEELTVEFLASQCHMHVDYYSRSFKNLFGIRPISYIQSQRIQRAQLLLATTTNTIPEIATKVGLPNLSYFSRLFKKLTGKSPGEFRKFQWEV